MTIEKAETLVCPYKDNMVDTFCITDKCMAWQEVESEKYNISDEELAEKVAEVAGTTVYTPEEYQPIEYEILKNYTKEKLPKHKCRGYCGRLVND